MSPKKPLTYYNRLEERINILSHGAGIVLAFTALALLVIQAVRNGDVRHIVSFSIYGVSMVTLYTASTLYHSAVDETRRRRLKVFDHASIYALIAGTYTPFTLTVLPGAYGWTLFGITWGFAVTGIILKLFFTGRFNMLSTILYVLLGWSIVFAVKPLIENFPPGGLLWLLLGGISYTVGAVIYSIKRIKFNHAVFHVFVLLGSISHFWAIYFYVIPRG